MKSRKNKLTNLLKTGILLFGISLFLWNCQTENSNDFTSENQPSISIEKIKTQFNASFNKNAFPRLNKEPLWEEAKTSYNQEGSQYIEIPFYKLYQEDIEMSSTLSFDKILVSKNIDDKLEIKIVHFFATDLKNKSIDFNQITHSELSGFNGFVTHFDLHKNPLEIKRYNNGRDTNQDFTYKDPKEIDRSLMSRDDDVANYFSETVCTRGCYYWEYSDGSRETISCSAWDCTSINMYVPNGGGGGGSNGASYNTERETEKIEDDKIINELTDKAKCVYNKLNSMSASFKNSIQKFDGQFPVAHLKFSINNELPSTTNAETSNAGTHFIEISLNGKTLSSRTTLGLARTFIHETIHAEMYRKLRSVGYSVSIDDFPGIYDYYRRHKNWQHQQMASHFRETISSSLKDFDNNQQSQQLYDDLAWVGLQGTVAWNNLSLSERRLITSAVINYKSSGNKTCN